MGFLEVSRSLVVISWNGRKQGESDQPDFLL